MKQTITIRGNVATAPKRVVTDKDLVITEFRLASTERKFDREDNTWTDGETNWVTVTTYSAVAENAYRSLQVGDPVVVMGRLSVRDWVSSKDETKQGTAVHVVAQTLGHDMVLGFTQFTKAKPSQVSYQDDNDSIVTDISGPLVDHTGTWDRGEELKTA